MPKPVILPLTPLEELENFEPYSTRLDALLGSRDLKIRNIAITGKFGAGKSSVLKSYFRNKKVLWVTLAPFIDIAGNGDKRCRSKDRLRRLLEESVLKQMFYTTRRKDLPFSRFSRIVHNHLGVYLFASLVCLSLLAVVFFAWQPAGIWSHLSGVSNVERASLCRGALYFSVVPLTVLVMVACDAIRRRRFHGKLSAVGTDIEVGLSDRDLAFNRISDEVIYHFQHIKYDAVIFEDIDRFQGSFIFSKLKEMNHIINESKDIGDERKPIRFIYALRDVALRDEERVKFFDYILPIVPVSSVANSIDLFVAGLKKILNVEVLDQSVMSLVGAVSQYIVDMRLLNNICNEFSVYKEVMGEDVTNANLLGMIVFKNVLPLEYENLLCGGGALCDLFKRKDDAVAAIKVGVDKKIEELTSQMESYVSSGETKQAEDTKIEIEKKRRGRDQWDFFNLRTMFRLRRMGISDVYTVLGFRFRKESGKWINEHKTSMRYTDRQVNVLHALVTGGYLDENYKYYLSVLGSEIISKNDRKFVLSVVGDSPLPWEYALDSVANVCLELQSWLFERKSIRNFILLHSAFINNAIPSDKREVFLSYVFSQQSVDYRFVDKFLETHAAESELLREVHKAIKLYSPTYYNQLVRIDDKDVSDGRKLLQLGQVMGIDLASMASIATSEVCAFLAAHPQIAAMFRGMRLSDGQILDLLSLGRIKFDSIDFSDVGIENVLEVVLKTGSYMWNPALMKELVGYYKLSIEDWNQKRCSLVYSVPNANLKARINADIHQFLEGIYYSADELQTDDLEFIKFVLNHQAISDDDGKRFLDRQRIGLETSSVIHRDDLVAFAMDNGKLAASWNNAIDYYKRFIEKADVEPEGVDQSLVDVYRRKVCDYFIRHRTIFEKSKLTTDYKYDYILISLLVGCPDIHDTYVEQLLDNCGKLKGRLYIEDGIPARRLRLLADRDLIAFTENTFNRLKRLGNGLHIKYASVLPEPFANHVGKLDVSDEDLAAIINEGSDFPIELVAAMAKNEIERVKRNGGFAKAIAKFISLGTFSRFESNVVCQCFGYLSPAALQCQVMVDYSFDAENMLKAIRLMPEPFRSLEKFGTEISLPRSSLVETLVSKLVELKIINGFELEAGYVKVTIASTDPTVNESPF